MRLLKLTIAASISGLFVGAGTVAHAFTPDTYYTYVFTADSDAGNTSFDGSTITIDATTDSISSWDLLDSAFGINLTSGTVNWDNTSVTYADPTTWTGNFEIDFGFDALFAPAYDQSEDYFIGSNDGTADNSGALDVNYVNFQADPTGSWTPVPDALNSLQLLALALAGLGACSQLLFRRQAVVLP